MTQAPLSISALGAVGYASVRRDVDHLRHPLRPASTVCCSPDLALGVYICASAHMREGGVFARTPLKALLLDMQRSRSG